MPPANPPIAAPGATSLLERVARGDQSAIRECLARYGGLVWSLARRHAGGDAEDAVQDIFVDVWRSAEHFDPAVASEPTFIAMIARRRLVDRYRRERRRDAAAPTLERSAAAAASDASPTPERCAEAARAARALQALRPEQREVLVLATCEGWSHDEIARKTGMPLGTVKAHARRGLSSIRAAVLGVPEEEPT